MDSFQITVSIFFEWKLNLIRLMEVHFTCNHVILLYQWDLKDSNKNPLQKVVCPGYDTKLHLMMRLQFWRSPGQSGLRSNGNEWVLHPLNQRWCSIVYFRNLCLMRLNSVITAVETTKNTCFAKREGTVDHSGLGYPSSNPEQGCWHFT